MAGNENSGGHNATIGVDAPDHGAQLWPWEKRPRRRPDGGWTKPWTFERIRRHLLANLSPRGVRFGVSPDALSQLARAHERLAAAKRAIYLADDDDPKVGRRSAHGLAREADLDVARCWRQLGVWPMLRPAAEHDVDDGDDEFAQPTG